MRTFYRALMGFTLAAVVVACSPTPIVVNDDADSQHFMDTTIPAIYGHWDINALASVADKSVYTPERLAHARERFAGWSTSYGPMVTYHGAKGTTRILRTKDGETKAASYDAEVTFKKATVTVHIDAAKNNGKWLVENMSLQPAGHHNPTH